MSKRAFVTATALALTLAAWPTSARADDVSFTFDEPSTVTVQYGTYWQFVGSTTLDFAFGASTLTVRSQSADFPDPGFSVYPEQSTGATKVLFMPASSGEPLPVGRYDLDIALDTIGFGNTPVHTRATGAVLEVVPALLATSIALEADPTVGGGAVVTGTLSRDYGDGEASNPGALAAGSWSFSIKDDKGAVVLEKTLETAVGGPPTVSFYWSGAKPNVDYSATVSFAFDGDGAANYSINSTEPVAFRTDVPLRQTPVSESPGETPPAQGPVGFTVPGGLALAAAILLIALLTVIVVLLVRGRGSRERSTGQTHGSAEGGVQ